METCIILTAMATSSSSTGYCIISAFPDESVRCVSSSMSNSLVKILPAYNSLSVQAEIRC